MSLSQARLPIIIDANLAVRAVLPVGDGGEIDLFSRWRRENRPVFAPDVWHAEVTTVVRRAVSFKMIRAEEATQAMKDLFALGVQIIPSDLSLCQAALEWAERLGQAKAYDSFYLALAELLTTQGGLQTEFWTGDERLVNRSHQLNVYWVRWSGAHP